MNEINMNKTNLAEGKIYKVTGEEKNTGKDSFAKSSSVDDLFINLKHLNDLKETLTTPEGKKINIWAIYADPSVPGDRKSPYTHIGDEDEGLGCVDDVARAAITYIKHYKYNNDPESLKMAKEALDFVMYMQAEDGQFYNFVFPDGSINKDGHTSKKSFGHWAVEGLWGMCEGYCLFKDIDPSYAQKLDNHIQKSLTNLIPSNPDSPLSNYGEYKNVDGHSMPAWLIGDGSDQSSIAVAGLSAYYEAKPDPVTKEIIEKLCDGIMKMRGNSPDEFPFGSYLSSLCPNQWHAWGSRQMMALGNAGHVLGRKDWIKSAEGEANQWVTHLNSSTGMLFGMGPAPIFYPNQAYGNEVLTEGLLSLYEATGKEVYAKQAGLMASWLTGNNTGKEPVYDQETGRVFDGVDETRVSFGSGAESTICGLIELMDVIENPVAKKYLDYKEISSHTFRVIEGERGRPIEGKVPIIIRHDGGEGMYSGKAFAELDKGDVMSWNLRISHQGEYIPYLVYTDGAKGEIQLSINGNPLETFDLSHNSRELLKLNKLRAVNLKEGNHEIKIAFNSESQEGKTNLDAIILQPAIENRFFRNSKGETLGIFKSFKSDTVMVKSSWPGEKDMVVIHNYDKDGNVTGEKELQVTEENQLIELSVNPYGYSIIEKK